MSLIKVENLKKTYLQRSGWFGTKQVQALRGVSFELEAGQTLAVVGESGCGKTTLAKSLLKLEPMSDGDVILDGKSIKELNQKALPNLIQMIFQDPYSSLNPRKKIKDIVAEPLLIQAELSVSEIFQKVAETLASVGLRPELGDRFPHMLSGGQRQRVGIARAFVTNPKVIVCDEPVSALDVSVQAQVLNLLLDLQKSKKVSYIFISHDLSVVRFIAQKVVVMYLGQIVEYGDKKQIFENPQHPYTKLLLDSAPLIDNALESDANRIVPTGELPSPLNPPSGCAFHTRCPFATEVCHKESPVLRKHSSGALVSCHHVN